MKKICFITGTRADYGIMQPVMKELKKSPDVVLQIIATNMHLSPLYGMTVNEIEKDGFTVDVKIKSLEDSGYARSTVASMAKVMEGLAEAFELLQPDLIVVLGDRYEALASASAATVYNIPLVHLHGGETTEGAIDDKFRHAITQLADYHFASTSQYADRIISMGASPENVFHSGAPGAEWNDERYSEPEDIRIEKFRVKTGLNEYDCFIILAFHPVTTLADKGLKELQATLEAIDRFIKQGYKILATMPNSDPGSQEIIAALTEWAEDNPDNVTMVKSLGSDLFHHAMENASAIIGNSSAALIEAPTHRLPAVNVGIRQKGRAHGIAVLDSPATAQKIATTLEAALSMEMKSVIMAQSVAALNPYFKQGSSAFIAERLLEILHSDFLLNKNIYD